MYPYEKARNLQQLNSLNAYERNRLNPLETFVTPTELVLDAGADAGVEKILKSSAAKKASGEIIQPGAAARPKSPKINVASADKSSSAYALNNARDAFGKKKLFNGDGIKGFWSNSVKPNFGYSLKDGAKVFGKNLGGWTGAGTIVPAIMQGAQAIGSLGELDDLNKSTVDLIFDILVSANSNPLVNSYLTSDQKSLLRQAKTGKLEDELSMSLGDFMPNDLTDFLDIGKGALTGVLGGLPGIIVGGIGGAINSGLDNAIDERSASTAELEALLYALQDAEMQYQSMKRPNFTGLGIQQRYQDMYR